jgi:RNA polymerase sigma-70 factor (ECF subfamily)
MTREQFIAIVKTEQEPLRRFLLALCCGNRDEADDIAQDALVKAYLSFSKYEGTTWLYRIAYHLFIDSAHCRHNMQPLNVLEKQEDANFAADRNFRYQSLYIVLEELPSKERTAILLFYLKGYTIREIAGIVNATEDAVKKQLSRGRDKLKTLLKDE